MTWMQTEFLLKGLYLGLLLTVAIQAPTPRELALVGACTAGGLALCLGVAAVNKIREGYRVGGRILGFVLFLLLENPRLVFAGLGIGLCAGSAVPFWGRGWGYATGW